MIILIIFAIYIVLGVALGIYTMKQLNKQDSKQEKVVRRNRTIIDSK